MTEIKKADAWKINLQGNYKTFYIGSLIALLITILMYVVLEKYNQEYDIRDLVAIFTGGILATTLLYHSKTIRYSQTLHNDRIEFEKEKFEYQKEKVDKEFSYEKEKLSYDITNKWHDPVFSPFVNQSYVFLNKYKKEIESGQKMSDFDTVFDANPNERLAVITILNYFEHLSLLIDEDFVEETVIKKCFKTLFIDYFSRLKRYIECMAEDKPRIFMNFIKIAQKWQTE